MHLTLDAVGAAPLAIPWLLGFANKRAARNVFIGTGIFGFIAGLLPERDVPQGNENED